MINERKVKMYNRVNFYGDEKVLMEKSNQT